MSSASKTIPIVHQLALTATRPSALRTATLTRTTSPRVFNALTGSALQKRHYASQVSTASTTSSLPQDQPPEILRRLQELEKSHAATQLENKKQWQHLHRHDQALGHPRANIVHLAHDNTGSKPAQDAIDNSEILHQIEELKSTVAALEQIKTSNTTPQDAHGLTSLGSTDAVTDSETLRQLNDYQPSSATLRAFNAALGSTNAAQLTLISQLKTTNAIMRHENEVLCGPHVNVERRAPDDGKTNQSNDTREQRKDGERSEPQLDGFTRFIVHFAASFTGFGICTYFQGHPFACQDC